MELPAPDRPRGLLDREYSFCSLQGWLSNVSEIYKTFAKSKRACRPTAQHRFGLLSLSRLSWLGFLPTSLMSFAMLRALPIVCAALDFRCATAPLLPE